MTAVNLSNIFFTDKCEFSANAVTDDAINIQDPNAQSGINKTNLAIHLPRNNLPEYLH